MMWAEGMPFLGFLQWSLQMGRAGAVPARAAVSSEGMCLLVSLQNAHHTHFSLPVAKSRVLSYRKILHQGNPQVWPGKLPCPLEQGVHCGWLAA